VRVRLLKPALAEPVRELGGVPWRPARSTHGERDDRLEHVAVIGGALCAVFDQVHERGGELFGRKLPQQDPGIVRPDRCRPCPSVTHDPPDPVSDLARSGSALAVDDDKQRMLVPAQAFGHESGPQPQQQRGLAGPGGTDHHLVRTQPLVGDGRHGACRMPHGPDRGAGDHVASGVQQRNRTGRGQPGSRRTCLPPPLPLVKRHRRCGGAADRARRHRGVPPSPGQAAGRQPQRNSGRQHANRRGGEPLVRPDDRSPAGREGDQPHAHRRQAPQHRHVQPPRRPAQQPRRRERASCHNGHRRQCDRDRGSDREQ